MRISDWSSDVCSSDLVARRPAVRPPLFETKARLVDKHRTTMGEGGPVQITSRRLSFAVSRCARAFPMLQPSIAAEDREAVGDSCYSSKPYGLFICLYKIIFRPVSC